MQCPKRDICLFAAGGPEGLTACALPWPWVHLLCAGFFLFLAYHVHFCHESILSVTVIVIIVKETWTPTMTSQGERLEPLG